MIVGFQGEPGAFSEEAAIARFGLIATQGFESFDALVERVASGEVPLGLLPCENSIHGSVVRAYDLLYAHPEIRIVDETVHRIEQALIGPPGASLAAVRRVESHPVALEQCRRFLAGLGDVEVVAVADTAGAVRAVASAGEGWRAAIGPAGSAGRYGATILATAIQDEPENYTRFFCIAHDGRPLRGLGRAVLAFVLPHRAGSLHRALGVFAERGLNLRGLVARPLPGRPFEYIFYAEIDCPDEALSQGLVEAAGGEGRVLGWF